MAYYLQLNLMNKFTAKLQKKIQISKNILLLRFKTKISLPFKPGQFLTVIMPNGARAYSIASAPSEEEKSFDLLVELFPNGLGSNYFRTSQIGTIVKFIGPAGQFTLRKNSKIKIFMATGVGLAPIRAMIKTLDNEKHEIPFSLYWGLRKQSDIYLEKELEDIERKNPHFDFTICLSREKTDSGNTQKGYVQDVFRKQLERNNENLADMEFYVCGAPIVVKSIIRDLKKLGANKENIYSERF